MRIATLVLVSLAWLPSVSAQTLPDAVTLDDVLAMAGTSPRVIAAATLAEAGLGDVTTAGTPENPVLSLDLFGLVWGEPTNGGSQWQAIVSQTFPWPGALEARVRAARAALEAERSLVALARALLELDLRRAFVMLLAAEERTAALREAQEALGQVAVIVRGRAEAGAGRRWDVVRVDAELATLDAGVLGARADEAAAAGRLAALLGRPGWEPRALGGFADLPAAPETGTTDEHPRVEAAHRAAEAADLALEREQMGAFPDFDLRLGYVGSTWPEGGYLYGGLSVPLPFFDLHRGAIERATAERDAAHESEVAVRAEVDASRDAARRALALRRAALEEFDETALAGLISASEMARAAYAGGEIAVFELLDAVRAARSLRVERVGVEEAYQRSVIDVLEADLVAAP